MWWGSGDSSRLDSDTKETLRALRRLEETGHVLTLDEHRAKLAVRAIEFYSQWESVIRLMHSVRNVAVLVGSLLAFYWATEGWIVEKVMEILK